MQKIGSILGTDFVNREKESHCNGVKNGDKNLWYILPLPFMCEPTRFCFNSISPSVVKFPHYFKELKSFVPKFLYAPVVMYFLLLDQVRIFLSFKILMQ